MSGSLRRVLLAGPFAVAAALCAAVAAFFGHAAVQGWYPPPTVDQLTPSGAGLEYNEWLVNWWVVFAISVFSLLIALLMAWLAWRRWRERPHPGPFPVAPRP